MRAEVEQPTSSPQGVRGTASRTKAIAYTAEQSLQISGPEAR